MRKKKQKQISRPNGLLSLKTDNALITYDKQADAAYFSVKKGKVARTMELDEWLMVDVDKKGVLLGIEMLFVSLRAPKHSLLSSLKVGKIPVFV